MKRIIPYIALIFGAIGLVAYLLTLFYPAFCDYALGSFAIAVILFIVCMIAGSCCAIRDARKEA